MAASAAAGAIKTVSILGSVINGTTPPEGALLTSSRHITTPSAGEESDGDEHTAWAHETATKLASFISGIPYAWQDEVKLPGGSESRMKHLLRVMAGNTVVKEWLLTERLDATQLIPYCVATPSSDVAAGTAASWAPYSFSIVAIEEGAEEGTIPKPKRARRQSGGKLAEVACSKVLDGLDVPFMAQIADELGVLHSGVVTSLIPGKLLIDGVDGRWEAGSDAPSDDVIGALILILPSPFEGGQVSVHAPIGGLPANAMEVQNACTAFNWAPKSAGTTALQWGACSDDCLLDVALVTAGHCVTLEFAVVAGSNAAKKCKLKHRREHQFAPQQRKRLRDVVDQVVDHVTSSPSEYFGIILNHKYTLAMAEKVALKGADYHIFTALVAAGLKVTILPVLYRSDCEIICDEPAKNTETVYEIAFADAVESRKGEAYASPFHFVRDIDVYAGSTSGKQKANLGVPGTAPLLLSEYCDLLRDHQSFALCLRPA